MIYLISVTVMLTCAIAVLLFIMLVDQLYKYFRNQSLLDTLTVRFMRDKQVEKIMPGETVLMRNDEHNFIYTNTGSEPVYVRFENVERP